MYLVSISLRCTRTHLHVPCDKNQHPLKLNKIHVGIVHLMVYSRALPNNSVKQIWLSNTYLGSHLHAGCRLSYH